MKRITLITTGQPSTNPRLVREVESLASRGFHVKVVYCFYQQWGLAFDKAIIQQNSASYFMCGGMPKGSVIGRFTYLFTKIRFKLANILFQKTLNPFFAELAINRCHSEVLELINSFENDLIIAHNLGALPAAVLASAHQNCKVGYDAEDLNSAQYNEKTDIGYILNKQIEDKYLLKTDYLTAASPLIAKYYKLNYPQLRPVVINNVVSRPAVPVKIKPVNSDAIKLFWFSQTIGKHRGLEQVIEALLFFDKADFELHLLGKVSKEIEHFFMQTLKGKNLNIKFHEPISPQDLVPFASHFDIGLATELSQPMNRDICLTNKVFTYIQSGLAIIASKTSAQSSLFGQYPNMGMMVEILNTQSIVLALKSYLGDKDLLNSHKTNALLHADKELNWESEESIFLSVIEKTLNDEALKNP